MPIVLLHVTGLAIALVPRIEVLVAGPVSISAIRPLGVGPFDGESSHPFMELILNGEGIGHVVARGAHFSANKHGLMKTFVLFGINTLIQNVLAEYLACIQILRSDRLVGFERTKRLKKTSLYGCVRFRVPLRAHELS